MDKILTVEDVASVLKVKPITVREMFRENRLRAFKVGKAWRTTEQMLQEDIDAIARGENPKPLVMGETAASQKIVEPVTATAAAEARVKTAKANPPAAVAEPAPVPAVEVIAPDLAPAPAPAETGMENEAETEPVAEEAVPVETEAQGEPETTVEPEAAPVTRSRRKKAEVPKEEGEEKAHPIRDEEPVDSQGLLF